MIRRTRARGFTLIELMMVVAIIGILSAIAIPAFQSYIKRSKVAEAVTFLGDVKQRQESYRAEFGQYCGDASDYNYHPAAVPVGADKVEWSDGAVPDAWTQLGANPDGQVFFQYGFIAGAPGTAPTGPDLGPANEFWFSSQARADFDDDGDTFFIEGYSHGNHVYMSDPKGWD